MYSSSNIIRGIKLRKMQWAGYVARLEAMRNKLLTTCKSENLKGRDHLGD
jgi:hypothetical protein